MYVCMLMHFIYACVYMCAYTHMQYIYACALYILPDSYNGLVCHSNIYCIIYILISVSY